jgi:hypothetical protein
MASPSRRREMAKHGGQARRVSIRLACWAFAVSESCWSFSNGSFFTNSTLTPSYRNITRLLHVFPVLSFLATLFQKPTLLSLAFRKIHMSISFPSSGYNWATSEQMLPPNRSRRSTGDDQHLIETVPAGTSATARHEANKLDNY